MTRLLTASPASTDLSIVKTAAPPVVNIGDTVTYGLSVDNTGGAASAVAVTDTIPAGWGYLSTTCAGGSFAAGVFTWNIGAMANPATIACNLVVTAGATLGVVANTAVVSSATNDTAPGNNSSTASVTVLGPADVSITKTTGSNSVALGSTVTFTLLATNNGPNPAVGVVVTDTLPAGMSYSSNSCGATFAAGTLTWNVGSLAVSGSASCNLVVTMGSGPIGLIVNTAAIGAANSEPTPGNNSSQAGVTLLAAIEIPALGISGLAVLTAVLAGLGFLALRKSS